MTTGRPPRCSSGELLSSIPGLRFRVLGSDTAKAPPLAGDLDKVGVAEPFAVVEKGDDLRRNSEQHQFAHFHWRIARDLGKFPEHQLPHPVYLLRVANTLRLAADRQAPDLVPAGVRRVDGERDVVAADDVFRLLRFGRTAEIYGEAVIDVADRRRLLIAIFADSRDRHVVRGIEDRDDILRHSRAHGDASASRLTRSS